MRGPPGLTPGLVALAHPRERGETTDQESPFPSHPEGTRRATAPRGYPGARGEVISGRITAVVARFASPVAVMAGHVPLLMLSLVVIKAALGALILTLVVLIRL